MCFLDLLILLKKVYLFFRKITIPIFLKLTELQKCKAHNYYQ